MIKTFNDKRTDRLFKKGRYKRVDKVLAENKDNNFNTNKLFAPGNIINTINLMLFQVAGG